jgi:hypothetical protein
MAVPSEPATSGVASKVAALTTLQTTTEGVEGVGGGGGGAGAAATVSVTGTVRLPALPPFRSLALAVTMMLAPAPGACGASAHLSSKVMTGPARAGKTLRV